MLKLIPDGGKVRCMVIGLMLISENMPLPPAVLQTWAEQMGLWGHREELQL